MDDANKPQSIDSAILEEETRERLEEIRREARKGERPGFKLFTKFAAGTLLAGVLVLGEIVGINYLANDQSYTRYDGTRVESRVEDWFGHTRFSHAQDGSRTITVYTPFEDITFRAYTDRDGDGNVDSVWRVRGHSHPLKGSRGSSYSREDDIFNVEYIDGMFQEGLESFGEPIIVESR